MITVDQANGTGLRTSFKNLRSFEGKVFYEYHPIPIGESISVRILDDLGSLRPGLTWPFMAASHTLPFFGVLQHVVHLAFRANLLAHREMIGPEEYASSFWVGGRAPKSRAGLKESSEVNRTKEPMKKRHRAEQIIRILKEVEWPGPDFWTVLNESRRRSSFYGFWGDFPAGTGAQDVARSGSSRFAAASGPR